LIGSLGLFYLSSSAFTETRYGDFLFGVMIFWLFSGFCFLTGVVIAQLCLFTLFNRKRNFFIVSIITTTIVFILIFAVLLKLKVLNFHGDIIGLLTYENTHSSNKIFFMRLLATELAIVYPTCLIFTFFSSKIQEPQELE
jgi:hypothetical protein